MPKPPRKTTIEPNEHIGNYIFTQVLDIGGQAEVWSARDETAERTVAIKVLEHTAEDVEQHKRTIERWKKETNIWANVCDHDNIVTFYTHEEHQRTVRDVLYTDHFLVMERALHNLQTHIHDHSLATLERKLECMRQVTDGLRHAHAHSIRPVHRDIKPKNILFFQTSKGEPLFKLSDFGIAKPEGSNDETRGAGTRPYMAPEQHDGHVPVQASDIYSLGVLFLFILIEKDPERVITDGRLNHRRMESFFGIGKTNSSPKVMELMTLIEEMMLHYTKRPTAQEVFDCIVKIQSRRESEINVDVEVHEERTRTQTVLNVSHRFLWHPEFHFQNQEKLRYYFLRAYFSSADLIGEIASALTRTLKQRYACYEVFGDFDVIVRAWATEDLHQSAERELKRITSLIRGDLQVFPVEKLYYHWLPTKQGLPKGQFDTSFCNELVASAHTSLTVARRLLRARNYIIDDMPQSPLRRGKKPKYIKVFTGLRLFQADGDGNRDLFEDLKLFALRESFDGISRVSIYSTVESRWKAIIKFHARDYNCIRILPTMLHADRSLARFRFRTDTFFDTGARIHESDDGPFMEALARE